jgi:hypothetical protein
MLQYAGFYTWQLEFSIRQAVNLEVVDACTYSVFNFQTVDTLLKASFHFGIEFSFLLAPEFMLKCCFFL